MGPHSRPLAFDASGLVIVAFRSRERAYFQPAETATIEFEIPSEFIMKPLPRRRGFSLVEFVVVLAIIATGASLLPAAIQQAREAARRSSCKNNLKQIAIALHNYHDTHKTLPPAWIAKTPAPTTPTGFGWMTFLLPFVDEIQIYNAIDFNEPLPAADALGERSRQPIFQTRFAVYRCPSDPTSAANPMRGNYGTSNYSANIGDLSLPRWTTGRRTAFWPGQIDTPRRTNGMMSWNSRIGFRDVTDGLSNTFMVGERCATSASGIWPGVKSNAFENDAVTDCSHGSQLNQSPSSGESGGRGDPQVRTQLH
jgi:prepilin-type N-terminal cleavage/methylation domain-containing protein